MKFLMIHLINEAVPPTDMDEAIEIASRHPTARIGTFELRPFWQ